jgi:hypothetical protein
VSDWTLVPCLVALRAEFDAIAPQRDRGSDGSKGDSNHNASSDHTPDEDSPVLRDHDADSKNEVHALDIDSSGPWPGGPAWFDAAVHDIVGRHRRGEDDRLKYVIWNKQIANRDIGNWRWREYTATDDPHTGHAHFSSRYTTAQEQDTSPWGVADMPITTADQPLIREAAIQGLTFVLSEAARAANGDATGDNAADRAARGWRTYLRTIVGGPVDVAPILLAVQGLALPAGVSADDVAELVVQKLGTRLAS